jgi:hypothetical protein
LKRRDRRRVTFYEQAIGFVCVLIFLSAFIGALVLYTRASRRTRIAIVASSWFLAIALYWVVFFVLPEDSSMGWIPFMGLMFVFVFAFWGVIDFAIHSDVRLKGGEVARFVQGLALLAGSAVLFVAAYFVPGALDSLPVDVGFGGYFVSILSAALAAILCFRAGARAVYANRTALPRLFAARKATIEVTPEKAIYLQGETIHATVRVKGKNDFDIDGARVELLYTNRYSYLTPDPRGGSLLIDETDRKIVHTESLPTGGTIRRGMTTEHRASLGLPTDAPPTGEGEITGVAWAVRVVLGVPGGPDVSAQAPITVLAARDTYARRTENEPEPLSTQEVLMKFRLTGCSLRAGEQVQGGLVITPRKAFEGRRIGVELVRREIVMRDDGNHHETVEAEETVAERTRFHPRTSQKYPFSMAVPRDLACPSSKTERTYVGWFLRGTIDRGSRPDYVIEQELNVYNGPRKDETD